ncbi:MAG TPA: MDR family MFS transporter [Trebonia sp.]
MKVPLSPKAVVAAVFVSAMFINIMDQTVVNVALPTLSKDFGASLASVSGTVTGFLVTLAVVMPASGWIGDRLGPKTVMLGSIAIFTGASALCGVSTSLPELITFRAVQGIGGGMMVPVGMAMLFRAFPPAERIRANQVLMIPTLLAPASGPVIGGLLVDGLSWRWIFFINVPVGVAGLIFGLIFLPAGSEHPAGTFDLPGFLLAATGFPLFMYAMTEGASDGWESTGILATLIPGAVLLAAFAVVELRRAAPLLHLRIFSNRLYRVTVLQLTFAGAGFFGTLFLVPLLLQNGLGFTALHSGLSTFTEALGGMTGIQLTSRLYKRVGPRRLMMAGMTGTIITIGGMAFADASTAPWLVPVLMFFTGGAFGFAMSPSQTAGLATISAAQTGQASTVLNTLRQAGAAVGVALIGTILGALHAGPASLTGFHVAFAAAAVLMVCGAIFSAFVRDSDAAATLVSDDAGQTGVSVPEAA